MELKAYSKSELAWAYSPNLSNAGALYRLREWIRVNKKLTAALKKCGYTPTTRVFTVNQVKLIFEYLGEP